MRDDKPQRHTLEGVMNSSPYAIASRYGYEKTIPQRRFRRRVGICCPLPGTPPRGRPSAHPRPARGPQRAEVDREDRVCLALHAPRPASVGGGLPANAAVAQSGCLRGDDPRSARTFAAFEGPGFGAFGDNTGLSHAESHSRERPSGRLRRTQGQEGLQGACPAVDTLGHLLALRVSPANEDDRKQVEKLAEEIQQATRENVEIAYVDQGNTGQRASGSAAEHGIRL